MQKFNQAVTELSKQKIFTNFKGNLVSAFGILENNNIIWQINYKDSNNKITTFTPSKEEKSEKQKSLDEDKELEIINKEDIKIDIDKALEILKKTLEKYKEEITKTIISLNKKETTFWNFTLLTTSLKVINIRIDTNSGDIIENKVNSILEFRKS